MKFKSRPYIAPLWDKINITLSFDKDDISAVEQLFDNIEPNIDYDIKIAQRRNKRSLDANAYAWVLLGMLAEHQGITPEEVYREQIKNMPTYEMLCIKEEAVDSFTRQWTSGHDGRSVIPMKSKIEGCVNLKCFYGSSDFDSLEMSRFIDNLLYECDVAGLFINDREKIEKAKQEW